MFSVSLNEKKKSFILVSGYSNRSVAIVCGMRLRTAHTHTHTHTHVYLSIYLSIYIYINTRARAWVRVRVYVYVIHTFLLPSNKDTINFVHGYGCSTLT